MAGQQIGVVGLAVMGENLALNIESKGFSVAVYNRSADKVTNLIKGRAAGKNFVGSTSPEGFVASLEKPRRVIMMVKAGAPVDEMIATLRPLLDKGDILIDGGNSFFKDTIRRGRELEAAGIRYIGTGISGGEEGALKGPSIMPGGPRDAYDLLAPALTRIAAQVDDGPCCAYIGPDGAGHFVKMVHNGIEYGDMQLIAEAYDVLRTALKLPAAELAGIFDEWNEGVLQSYLIEITGKILKKVDPDTGAPLVDLIVDQAEQKGTGKWTSQTALDLGVATPTINSAVEARIMSSLKSERVRAAGIIGGAVAGLDARGKSFVARVHHALYASKVCSYAQGMALIREASKEFAWGLNLAEIARIWKGGCIIRARFLDRISRAFAADPNLPNLLIDPDFNRDMLEAVESWRGVVGAAVELGIPVPALSASLAYFDSYRRACLPQNLTQAQRDFFGAHTYRRTDKEGSFHTVWE